MKFNKKAGAVTQIIFALMLAFSVTSMAFVLNGLHKTKAAQVLTILKTDYQMESAIVMQMQKLKANNSQPITKEIEAELRLVFQQSCAG